MEKLVVPELPGVERVEMNLTHFRPGSKMPKLRCNFVLIQGGVGDYVGEMAALIWVAKNCPHILGRIWCPSWFMPVAKSMLAKIEAKEWSVHDKNFLSDAELKRYPFYAPSHEPINRVGAHAVDLGFIYYLSMTPPPADGNVYPELELAPVEKFELPEAFAVLTPGASHKVKEMPWPAFNGVKDYFLKKGIGVVLLGNAGFDAKATTKYCQDYDFQGTLDLRGKTDLVEAASVMAKAKVVVGLDNGLLHLAATTPVDVVYGYTISSVQHTEPRRVPGRRTVNLHVDKAKLACMFCMSHMKLIPSYDFKECIYSDNACVVGLSDPEIWVKAIEALDAKVTL